MINFIRGILNDVKVSEIISNKYVLCFTSDIETVNEVISPDSTTSFIINSENNLYPNGILFGDERCVISTEDPEFTNGIIVSSNVYLHVYDYNKIFLYDRFKNFSKIIDELRYKITILGYPKYIMVYRYSNRQMQYIGFYQIIYDIIESQGSHYDIYAYINEFDKLKITEYTNI